MIVLAERAENMQVGWHTEEKGGTGKREGGAQKTQWVYCTKGAGYRTQKKGRNQVLPVLLLTF